MRILMIRFRLTDWKDSTPFRLFLSVSRRQHSTLSILILPRTVLCVIKTLFSVGSSYSGHLTLFIDARCFRKDLPTLFLVLTKGIEGLNLPDLLLPLGPNKINIVVSQVPDEEEDESAFINVLINSHN